MNVKSYIDKIVRDAKKASRLMAIADTSVKNAALEQMALNFINSKEILIVENEKDLRAAEENGLSAAMIDRLRLNEQRIEAMAEGIREVINLSDPVGEIMEGIVRQTVLIFKRSEFP